LLKYFKPLLYSTVTVPYQEALTLHYSNHAHQVETNQIKQFVPPCKMISNCWPKFDRL